MLRLDIESRQYAIREVAQVKGHDRLRIRTNRRSQYVSVVNIWQIQCGFHSFVIDDNTVGNRIAHETASASQRLRCQVGPAIANAPKTFIQYSLGPPGAHHPAMGNAK